MKTPLITILTCFAAIAWSSATHYQVYLLGGQSNANGRADAAQLTAPLNAAQTDVRFYWRRTQVVANVGHLVEDQWIDLAPGSGHGTGTPVYPKEFGPEVSYGRAMANAKPSQNIAIIKYSYGGTNLNNDWAATGTQYTTFVSTVQTALAALTTAGHTYQLRGMLWQQGEADSDNTTYANNYQTNLTNLITRVRADLNGGVAFPFVIGSLSNSQYGTSITTPGTGSYKVRQAQESVAAADPTVGIVITDGYSVRSDVIHFDHNGQVALGQAFATQMLALEGSNTNATLMLYSSTFGGNSATPLNGAAVNTSGATAAQHTQYGTSATATWSAAPSFKADGSYVHPGIANRVSGTLPFVPKNGYIYTLTMTTDYAVSAGIADWFATGFFRQPGYSGMMHTGNGATVFALTRPGSGFVNGDQVAHYNLLGGSGGVGVPSPSEDTSAPSTLKIVLNTTAGTGNWSATYYVGNDVLATKADLDAVDIESVGIGATIDLATFSGGRFQSFELSVSNPFATWISGKPGVNGQTAVNQDPDGDGIVNGVENFFGTEPGAFSQGLVAGTVSGNTLSITHPVNATPASDLTASYRWSTDLETFHNDGDSNGAGTTTVTFSDPTPAGGGLFSVTATITGPVIPGKLFVDVEVTQP